MWYSNFIAERDFWIRTYIFLNVRKDIALVIHSSIDVPLWFLPWQSLNLAIYQLSEVELLFIWTISPFPAVIELKLLVLSELDTNSGSRKRSLQLTECSRLDYDYLWLVFLKFDCVTFIGVTVPHIRLCICFNLIGSVDIIFSVFLFSKEINTNYCDDLIPIHMWVCSMIDLISQLAGAPQFDICRHVICW